MKRLKHWWWRRKRDKLWEQEAESEWEALEMMEEFDPGFTKEYLEHSPIPFCEFVKELRNIVHSDYGYEHTVGAWLDTRRTLNGIRQILLSCTYDTFDVHHGLGNPWSKWVKVSDVVSAAKNYVLRKEDMVLLHIVLEESEKGFVASSRSSIHCSEAYPTEAEAIGRYVQEHADAIGVFLNRAYPADRIKNEG